MTSDAEGEDDDDEEQRTHADDDLFAFCEGGGRGEFGEKAKMEGVGQVEARLRRGGRGSVPRGRRRTAWSIE